MPKGKRRFKGKSEGNASTQRKTRVRRPRTGNDVERTRRHSGQLAAREASNFVHSTVSSCHLHTRACGATAKDVQAEAEADAKAKAERAAALTVNDASPRCASVDQVVRYTKVVSHTPGGGGDGSSSKSRLSNHGGNQP